MGAAKKPMSNIPASERRATKIDFFDKAIDIRKESIISSKYSFIIMGYNESINSKFKEDNQNEVVCSTGK